MPPGYAAFFLWVASAVLWWSGWREETAEGIPDYAAAVFLAGWPLAAWNHTVIGGNVSVNGSFVWAALAMPALAWRMKASVRWTALSAGMLAGSLELLMITSEWIPYAPDWLSGRGSGVAVGVLISLLVAGASGQVLAVTFALLLSECAPIVWMQEGSAAVSIGTGRWMESWWAAVLSARASSVLRSFAGVRIMALLRRREGEGS